MQEMSLASGSTDVVRPLLIVAQVISDAQHATTCINPEVVSGISVANDVKLDDVEGFLHEQHASEL